MRQRKRKWLPRETSTSKISWKIPVQTKRFFKSTIFFYEGVSCAARNEKKEVAGKKTSRREEEEEEERFERENKTQTLGKTTATTTSKHTAGPRWKIAFSTTPRTISTWLPPRLLLHGVFTEKGWGKKRKWRKRRRKRRRRRRMRKRNEKNPKSNTRSQQAAAAYHRAYEMPFGVDSNSKKRNRFLERRKEEKRTRRSRGARGEDARSHHQGPCDRPFLSSARRRCELWRKMG